jgi:hypothetical protein
MDRALLKIGSEKALVAKPFIDGGIEIIQG